MTVIAFDGRYLVADGRMTADGTLISDQYDKLFETHVLGHGKCIVGLAGSCNLIGPALDILREEGLTKIPVSDWSSDREACLKALIITSKGVCIEFTDEGGWFVAPQHTSIGSGWIVAQHYLLKGETAITAVKETCKTEVGCGGRITVYDLKTKSFMVIDP
jgi:hypothetical protein